jgi:hypothetical protein
MPYNAMRCGELQDTSLYLRFRMRFKCAQQFDTSHQYSSACTTNMHNIERCVSVSNLSSFTSCIVHVPRQDICQGRKAGEHEASPPVMFCHELVDSRVLHKRYSNLTSAPRIVVIVVMMS